MRKRNKAKILHLKLKTFDIIKTFKKRKKRQKLIFLNSTYLFSQMK